MLPVSDWCPSLSFSCHLLLPSLIPLCRSPAPMQSSLNTKVTSSLNHRTTISTYSLMMTLLPSSFTVLRSAWPCLACLPLSVPLCWLPQAEGQEVQTRPLLQRLSSQKVQRECRRHFGGGGTVPDAFFRPTSTSPASLPFPLREALPSSPSSARCHRHLSPARVPQQRDCIQGGSY